MELHLTAGGIDWILYVSTYTYYAGCPEEGPTYSSGGQPAEPAEVIIEEGYLQLAEESKITNEVNLLLKEHSNLFDFFVEEYTNDVQEKAMEWVQNFFEPECTYEPLPE